MADVVRVSDEVVVEVPTVDLTGGAGGSCYVVQRAGVGELCATWTDVARVFAPARSRRATIIRAALSSEPLEVAPFVLRVLDVEAAREHRVSVREVAPELVIG